jgi:hypothetical protein
MSHISRNAITGNYALVQGVEMGGLVVPSRITLASAPDPEPGIAILGERLELDLGQEMVIFEFVRQYQPIPAGVRAPRLYHQVSFSLLP